MPCGARLRWRTVDIVVTAVLGVAFGVVFWAWGLLWNATGAAFTAFPPAQAFMYGVWLLPAVVAPLIVRKAGAAPVRRAGRRRRLRAAGLGVGTLRCCSTGCCRAWPARPGTPRSATAASAGRRRCSRPLLAGAMAAVLDLVYWYPLWSGGWKLTYVVLVVASTAVISGLGGRALVRALARTGALSSFTAGRSRV